MGIYKIYTNVGKEGGDRKKTVVKLVIYSY